MRIWTLSVPLAAAALAGCASPTPFEWDHTLYRAAVDRAAHDPGSTPATPARLPAPDAPLTIDDAVRLALANHPELRRAAFEVSAAAARETQAGLLPNPSVGLEFEALGAHDAEGGDTIATVEQEFLTAGKLAKAAAVAESERLAIQSVFLETAADVARSARVAWIAAVAAEQRLDAHRELRDVARELLNAAESRIRAGIATEPDRLAAEVALEQAEIDAHAAMNRAAATRAALASVLGLESRLDTPLASDLPPLPTLPDRDTLVALVLDRHPRVAQARQAIERARRAHDLARAAAVPNLTAYAGPRYSDADNNTTLDLGLRVAIPLFDRNQGNIAASQAERMTAAASLGVLRLELAASVAEAWASYQEARFAASAYADSLLPKARRLFDLTREAHRIGEADAIRLLEAQQTLARARLASVDALESLHRAAAAIDTLLRTPDLTDTSSEGHTR